MGGWVPVGPPYREGSTEELSDKFSRWFAWSLDLAAMRHRQLSYAIKVPVYFNTDRKDGSMGIGQLSVMSSACAIPVTIHLRLDRGNKIRKFMVTELVAHHHRFTDPVSNMNSMTFPFFFNAADYL